MPPQAGPPSPKVPRVGPLLCTTQSRPVWVRGEEQREHTRPPAGGWEGLRSLESLLPLVLRAGSSC